MVFVALVAVVALVIVAALVFAVVVVVVVAVVAVVSPRISSSFSHSWLPTRAVARHVDRHRVDPYKSLRHENHCDFWECYNHY